MKTGTINLRSRTREVPEKKVGESVYRRMMKNIIKNYAQAACSFVMNPLFEENVREECLKAGIDFKEFIKYITKEKKLLFGMERFKNMLLPMGNESAKMKGFKKAFRELSIYFVKYYSVKWIYDGKMKWRQVHLKMRH
mmetsp:Transcript_10291/g.8851  ORF Transcript_10291/g.8851 Transcript_10291/m.8851 type:complete len:138 (+) Transcript_10291:169-582(+)